MRALPESHFSVCFFDVILRGGASDAKDLVVVLAHPHYLIVTTWGSFRQVWSLTHFYSVSYLQSNIIVEGYSMCKTQIQGLRQLFQSTVSWDLPAWQGTPDSDFRPLGQIFFYQKQTEKSCVSRQTCGGPSF